jgi:death-on-curing protein
MPFVFLTVDEVVREQELQLELYGGGRPGILDAGRLDSAVNSPRATFGGELLHSDVFDMAAAYLKYLVSGHAFGNGNKRIGLSTALQFLHANGHTVTASEEELVQLVLDVANRQADIDSAGSFFRGHSQPITPAPGGDRQLLLNEAQRWVHQTQSQVFQQLADL